MYLQKYLNTMPMSDTSFKSSSRANFSILNHVNLRDAKREVNSTLEIISTFVVVFILNRKKMASKN